MQLAIISDIHYAGPLEQLRKEYYLDHINSRAQRVGVALYRKYFWQRDPFEHNHLLDKFIDRASGSDVVVANGDYSCDSAAIGMADDAAFESARECLGKLRNAFAGRLEATIGDHELGKMPLGADRGGLRLASYFRAEKGLGLKPFWRRDTGKFILIGITSSLAAFPVYASESVETERLDWEQLREQHLKQICDAFLQLDPQQRVLLFCHDPTALPFLWQQDAVREKIGQIERTIIGHLHSPLILFKSRLLAGMPIINFLGHTPRRLSTALREARLWKPFNILLCPSLSGIELLKDGGFYTTRLSGGAAGRLEFKFERISWQ